MHIDNSIEYITLNNSDDCVIRDDIKKGVYNNVHSNNNSEYGPVMIV